MLLVPYMPWGDAAYCWHYYWILRFSFFSTFKYFVIIYFFYFIVKAQNGRVSRWNQVNTTSTVCDQFLWLWIWSESLRWNSINCPILHHIFFIYSYVHCVHVFAMGCLWCVLSVFSRASLVAIWSGNSLPQPPSNTSTHGQVGNIML